jgi:hypothetical protein
MTPARRRRNRMEMDLTAKNAESAKSSGFVSLRSWRV